MLESFVVLSFYFAVIRGNPNRCHESKASTYKDNILYFGL